jgi:hypothetical protein
MAKGSEMGGQQISKADQPRVSSSSMRKTQSDTPSLQYRVQGIKTFNKSSPRKMDRATRG